MPASLVQTPEGVRADDSIDRYAAFLLESSHGAVELGVEDDFVEFDSGGCVTTQTEVRKTCTHLGDRRPGRTEADDCVYRKSARSASSAALGFAPMIVLTTWPPLYTFMVGMDVIP